MAGPASAPRTVTKEPEVDRDVPFRDVRKAQAIRRLSGPRAGAG
jgi:hypothetical protein